MPPLRKSGAITKRDEDSAADTVTRRAKSLLSTARVIDGAWGEHDIAIGLFYASADVRWALATAGRSTTRRIVNVLCGKRWRKVDDEDAYARCEEQLQWLAAWGFAIRTTETTDDLETKRFAPTSECLASLAWSAPAPLTAEPDGRSEEAHRRRVAGQLAYEIALLHGCQTHAMLRSKAVGPHVMARARLVYALHARGWAYGAIERHFGMPSGLAKMGAARWKQTQLGGVE